MNVHRFYPSCQHSLRFAILFLGPRDMMGIKTRLVLLEVIQPPIQLLQNMIQPFDEILSVAPHLDPGEAILD